MLGWKKHKLESGLPGDHMWNRSPVQVQCMRKGAQGWCSGMTQRDGMGREVGGMFSMGNTCTPMVDSCQYVAKPLHKSTLSKSMRCTKNCNTCSQHWSTEWAQFFPMTMPDHRSHNPHFKSWMNLATKFCLICHIHLTSHQLTTTSSSISTSPCLQGKHFHNQQEAKSAKVCQIPKHGLLCYGDKQTYFSLAKNVLIVMVPILINKDMLQPSYNV